MNSVTASLRQAVASIPASRHGADNGGPFPFSGHDGADQPVHHGVDAAHLGAQPPRPRARQPIRQAEQRERVDLRNARLVAREGRHHLARRRGAQAAAEQGAADHLRRQLRHLGQHVHRRAGGKRRPGRGAFGRRLGHGRRELREARRVGDGRHRAAPLAPHQPVGDEQPVAQQRLQRVAHLRALALQRRRLVDERGLHRFRAVADQDRLRQHAGGDRILRELVGRPHFEEVAPRPPQQLRQWQPAGVPRREGRDVAVQASPGGCGAARSSATRASPGAC